VYSYPNQLFDASDTDSILKLFLINLFPAFPIGAISEHRRPKHPDALSTKDGFVLLEPFNRKFSLEPLNSFRLDVGSK
jgi:hypothetical protein